MYQFGYRCGLNSILPPLLISTHIMIKLGTLKSQATVPVIQCQQILKRSEDEVLQS